MARYLKIFAIILGILIFLNLVYICIEVGGSLSKMVDAIEDEVEDGPMEVI